MSRGGVTQVRFPPSSPQAIEDAVSSHKVEQRRLNFRGRDFHFVSYEGHAADAKKDLPAMPAMWYLMRAGKRWPAIPHVPGQDPDTLDQALEVWIKDEVLRPKPATRK